MRFLNLFGVLAFVLVSAVQPVTANEPTSYATFVQLAKKMPGFRMIQNRPPVPGTRFLKDGQQTTTLQEFKGKALLVNFWATWCTPCVKEMPDLNEIAEDYADQPFEVVAIASGQQVGKNPDAFLKEHELTALDLYMDPHASLMTLFETKTLPTTLVVDKKGRILGGIVGAAKWNSKEARDLLAHLMQE